MGRRTERRERCRGGALLLATISVGVVAVVTTCLLQVVSVSNRREQSALDTRRAFYLAEAGLAEAYAGIRVGKTGRVGTRTTPARLGDGLFWVEATDPDEGRIELTSTALCGVGRASLSMHVEQGEQSVATLGVFSSAALSIPPGSTIQGYDSEGGPGLATGRIGSNGNISATGTILRPTVIRADLLPGPRMTAILGPNVTHEGGIEPRDAAVALPAVEIPFVPTSPGVYHNAPIPLVLPSGDVEKAFLRVAADSQVIAQGPCDLVVNDLILEPGATLEFDTQLGAIRVWVLGSLTMDAGSEVACSDTDSSQVLMQVASASPALMASNGALYGVVYAPSAEVTIGSQAELHGSVVAKKLNLTAGAMLSFDQHLDQTSEEAQMPKLLSWRILELANSTGPGGANDPFAKMGLDPALLPPPAIAHEDQVLDVTYTDKGGVVLTYNGMESGFDWTDVREVDSLSRDGALVALPPPDTLPTPPTPPDSIATTTIRNTSLTSGALSTTLIALPPLTLTEILAVTHRQPPLNSSDLRDVLIDNSRLGSTALLAVMDRDVPMDSSHLRDVLDASSPLPPDVLARVITGPTPLDSTDKQAVLSRNGVDTRAIY
ncbi:MAG: hypothetical protein ACKVXR_08400 [Planctomycetota bacterium]